MMLSRTKSLLVLVAILGLGVVSAQAQTVFSDDFENDILGDLPTIAAPDVGGGYTVLSGTIANSDIEDDATSGLTLDPRAGQYLNIANDSCCENGSIIGDFSGAVTSATAIFDVNLASDPAGASGASTRIIFTNATTPISSANIALGTGDFWTSQAGIGLPVGADGDDVMLGYFPGGSWTLLPALGGTIEDAVIADAEGTWLTVEVSQSANGGEPMFILNGTVMEPLPLPATEVAIDGLKFASVGGGFSQAYIDNVSITGVPEPSSVALLIIAMAGGLLRLRRKMA